MKKILILFLCVLACFGFALTMKRSSSDHKFYYIANNENHFFDESKDGAPVPNFSGSMPFNQLPTIDDCIYSVKPYYPIFVGDESLNHTVALNLSYDGSHEIKELPYEFEKGKYLNLIALTSYVDENQF